MKEEAKSESKGLTKEDFADEFLFKIYKYIHDLCHQYPVDASFSFEGGQADFVAPRGACYGRALDEINKILFGVPKENGVPIELECEHTSNGWVVKRR